MAWMVSGSLWGLALGGFPAHHSASQAIECPVACCNQHRSTPFQGPDTPGFRSRGLPANQPRRRPQGSAATLILIVATHCMSFCGGEQNGKREKRKANSPQYERRTQPPNTRAARYYCSLSSRSTSTPTCVVRSAIPRAEFKRLAQTADPPALLGWPSDLLAGCQFPIHSVQSARPYMCPDSSASFHNPSSILAHQVRSGGGVSYDASSTLASMTTTTVRGRRRRPAGCKIESRS